MKRTIPLLALTLITTLALAQQPRRPMPMDGPGGPDRGPRPDIAAFLGLTSDQKTQFDALHESLRTTVEPLFDRKREAEEQLHALVDAAKPDATAIGNQVLAMKAIDDQIKAAHDATKTKIEAILTADQRLKFEALHAARQFGHPRPPR